MKEQFKRFFTYERVKHCLILILLIVCINLAWNIRVLVKESKETVIEGRRGVSAGADYVETQTAAFESAEYQERLKANLNVGSKATKLLDELTKKTIPKLNKNLDSSDAALAEMKVTIESGRTFIANADTNINTGLLPEMTLLVRAFRLLTEEEIKATVVEFLKAGKNLRLITDDPALKSLPGEIDKLAKSLNVSAGKVEVVMENAKTATANVAGITGNLNAISEDAKKKTHALLNPPPAPFWKRYILYPLKDVGGVVYLLIRIANGL